MFDIIQRDGQVCSWAKQFGIIISTCAEPVEKAPWLWNQPLNMEAGTVNHQLIMFWLLVLYGVYGVYGILKNMYDYLLNASEDVDNPTAWFTNRFHMLPPHLCTALLLINGSVHMNAWIQLVYAALKIAPWHLNPFLFYYGIKLSAQWLLALTDQGRRNEWRQISTLLHTFLRIGLVYLYKNQMENSTMYIL